MARQDRVLDVAGALSPMAGLRRASMAAAATDAPHLRHFADAAERYRRELNRALNNFITDNSRTATGSSPPDPSCGSACPVGVLLGLGAAFAGHEPVTFLVVCLALIGVSLLACYLPARRTAGLDPPETLRVE